MSISNLRSLVRPIITIEMATGFVVGFFMGRFTADQYMVIGAACILWWFADRATNPRP